MDIEENIDKSPCLPRELCSVLVIDDDPDQLELIRHHLDKNLFDIVLCDSASQSLEILKERLPDIILMDIMMPEINGIDLLRIIRQNEKTAKIPVILISALNDSTYVVQGLQEGANDYVTKPINFPVLSARMKTHIGSVSLLKRLESQTHILSQMAAYDELTGVYNRRTMSEILDLELNRSRRYGSRLSLLMMDLDHFKKVNDEYGHLTGDQVLKGFAIRVNEHLRTNDSLCRYGGEEFLAILPETNEENAVKVGWRICSAISREPFIINDVPISMTVSIGAISRDGCAALNVEDYLKLADQAMYKAKKIGRNCVYFLKEQE